MRVIDSFDNGAALYPDNLAFVDGPEKINYREAQAQTRRIAATIRGHGYAAGTKIGILGPNANISFIALLGLFRSESVWLPVNPRNALEGNVDVLDRFDCELLMFHSNYETEARAIKEQVAGIKEIVCIDAKVDGITERFSAGEVLYVPAEQKHELANAGEGRLEVWLTVTPNVTPSHTFYEEQPDGTWARTTPRLDGRESLPPSA